MSQQANYVYYQNTYPPQVYFSPYDAPLTGDQPMQYLQVQGAYIEQSTLPNPNMSDPMWTDQLDAEHIRDYIWWSIINIVLGGVLLGAIAVLFSKMTIIRRERNDVQSDRRWSKITLIYNVLVDLVAVAVISILVISATGNLN